MQTFRAYAKKHAIVFAVSGLLLWMLLLLGISALIPYGLLTWDSYLPQLVLDVGLALTGILQLGLLGFGSCLRPAPRAKWPSQLLCGGYFFLAGASTLVQTLLRSSGGSVRSAGHLLLFVLTMLMIGVAEEVTFRGILATLLLRRYGTTAKGVWFCALLSGVLFGVPHLLNGIGSSGVGVLVQSVSAIGSGVAFTAVYYRTGNLWVPILAHAWIDFCGLIESGLYGDGTISSTISSYSLWQIVSVVPYLIIAAYLLRPEKMEEVIGRQKRSQI